jgi:hypothetical protein
VNRLHQLLDLHCNFDNLCHGVHQSHGRRELQFRDLRNE